MLELVYLALISDTTRVITFVPMEEGGLYHGTSHWNKNPEKNLPEMDTWDRKWIGGLAKLGSKLKAIRLRKPAPAKSEKLLRNSAVHFALVVETLLGTRWIDETARDLYRGPSERRRSRMFCFLGLGMWG